MAQRQQRALPNELIANLIEFLRDDQIFNVMVKSTPAGKLYLREANNAIEYLLKKHFHKRFVQTKNRWHIEGDGSKIAINIALDEQNPLIVGVKENAAHGRQWASILAFRPLSAVFERTYFELKMAEKKEDRLLFAIGLVHVPTRQTFGCIMATFNAGGGKPYSLGSRRFNVQCFDDGIAVGELFGCGFLVPPPPNAQQQNEGDEEAKTIVFTRNGKIIDRMQLPADIDFTQMYPFLHFYETCKLEANFDAKLD